MGETSNLSAGQVAGVVTGGVLLVAVFIGLPELLLWLDVSQGRVASGQEAALANEHRRTVAQALGGILVVLGLYLTLRRIRASERQVDAMEQANEERHDAAMAQLKATEDGQVTDRFSRAVEHLGSAKMEVRLGGIYALERIAKDSPDDHWTVMETLAGFVRERSAAEGDSLAEGERYRKGRPEIAYEEGHITFEEQPVEDIQAAVKVIGRRDVSNDPPNSYVDLRGMRLTNSFIYGLDLSDSILSNCYVYNCHIEKFKLYDIKVSGSLISDCTFNDTNLRFVSMNGSTMHNCYFKDLSMEGSHFKNGSNFEKVGLSNCDMSDCDFLMAYVDIISLSECSVDGLLFIECDMSDRTEKYLINTFGKELNKHTKSIEEWICEYSVEPS